MLNDSPNLKLPCLSSQPYIKERKKGNASKFYIAFLFDGDELTKDNMSGGAEDFMHHCLTCLKEEREKMMAQHLKGAV